MRIRESIRAAQKIMRERRISAARERLDYLLAHTPRHWRSIAVGGGAAVQLGEVTRAQALTMVAKGGDRVAFIDDAEAIIMTGESPAVEIVG